MSAIFGLINKQVNSVDPHIINALKSTLNHRTSNGCSYWCQNNAFFWHGNLLVHPQQLNENLPFQKDGLVIVADALLFNRDELFDIFSINKQMNLSDSELILIAYQKWGKDCVHHLDGEFVFAIWDTEDKTLLLATDHIGFRPVFYYDNADCFIFCSEIKGVVAAKKTPNYFNEEHIIEHFFRRPTPNQTFNKEIFALCGGNILSISSNKISIEKYWTLKPLGNYNFTKPEDWFNCLQLLLFKAVEKRLNADYPIGVTLSGGLDSTGITCILSDLLKKKNKPLYAFSSVLPLNHKGIEQDERKYIDIVLKKCGNIIETFVEAPNVDPFKNIEDAFENVECIPNSFYYMDRAILEIAKEKNIRSLFSGFGGDFFVSWNCKGIIHELIQEKKYTKAIATLSLLRLNDSKSFFSVFKNEYLVHTKEYHSLLSYYKKTFINPTQKTYALKKDFLARFPKKEFVKIPQYKNRILDLINQGRIGRFEGLFNNRNSFYAMQSFEPLFDKDLLEFLAEIPTELFGFHGHRRSLFRHSMSGVIPEEIQWRKNKIPYCPDFAARILKHSNSVHEIIEHPNNTVFFENYMEKNTLLDNLKKTKPFIGFKSDTSNNSIKLMQAILTIGSLSYLYYKKDYVIH